LGGGQSDVLTNEGKKKGKKGTPENGQGLPYGTNAARGPSTGPQARKKMQERRREEAIKAFLGCGTRGENDEKVPGRPTMK